MSDGFGKLVPGFDFLQNLVKSAGSTLPGIGQWVAPTLDPAEIEKRIEELKTVQFWLEQNARMLGATIQALEVQRMTLSTLQTMNVQMADLRDSLTIRLPESTRRMAAAAEPAAAWAAAPAPAPAAPPPPAAAPQAEAASAPAARARKPAAAPEAASGKKAQGPVDPLQWWGALTKQFTDLATSAIKDTAADAAKGFGAMTSRVKSAAGAQSPKSEAASHKAAKKRKPARKGARRAAKPAAKATAPEV
jgi:hypothetical protein